MRVRKHQLLFILEVTVTWKLLVLIPDCVDPFLVLGFPLGASVPLYSQNMHSRNHDLH